MKKYILTFGFLSLALVLNACTAQDRVEPPVDEPDPNPTTPVAPPPGIPDQPDSDGDAIIDIFDNCPNVPNVDQSDVDFDGIGDVCDDDEGDDDDGENTPPNQLPDFDGDGIEDPRDNCPEIANFLQNDADKDEVGDLCDAFPLDPNESQDSDGDGVGDNQDAFPQDANETLDTDSDGMGDNADNCPLVANNEGDDIQKDSDIDGIGDACDADKDGDGFEIDTDCDDLNTAINPDADEIADGVDNNCNDVVDEGTINFDDDGDGVAEKDGDCDDDNDRVFPRDGDLAEQFDFIDSDCNGTADLGLQANDVFLSSYLEGITNRGELGRRVAVVGDVNGDDIADYLVTDNYREDLTRVHLFFGQAANRLNAVDFDQPHVTFISEQEGGNRSFAISPAGDQNGDGLADFLIGDRHYDGDDAANAGKVYLIYGQASDDDSLNGWGVGLLDLSVIAPLGLGKAFLGQDSGERFGTSVALAGDVNGDDCDDFAIGAPGVGNGKVYLYFGTCNNDDPNHQIITGERFLDYAGVHVAGAGDVNDDGIDDILIGASQYDSGAHRSIGKVYLIYGSADDDIATELADADAGFTPEVPNLARFQYTGKKFSGAGDLNDDGIDDFVISVPNQDTAHQDEVGRAYIFFGHKEALTGDLNYEDADVTIEGQTNDGQLGTSLTSGDFDDDGIQDLVLGEPGTSVGRVSIFRGRENWKANYFVNEADASFIGEKSGDQLGFAVSSLGDLDGDDVDDLLIGAPRFDGEDLSNSGKAYLIMPIY